MFNGYAAEKFLLARRASCRTLARMDGGEGAGVGDAQAKRSIATDGFTGV
jgi:hypothetical protein